MVSLFKIIDYCEIFCCPDDLSNLSVHQEYLECQNCKRQFPRLAKNLIEILPKEFPKWNLKEGENKEAEETYYGFCLGKFNWKRKSSGWGFLPLQIPGYKLL